MTIPFEHERTKIGHLDHDDLGAVLGYDREGGNGLITGFTVGMLRDQYIGDFPSFGMPCEDVISTFGTSILHRSLAFGRFAPRFSYTYTSSHSTVKLFDYASHDVAVSYPLSFKDVVAESLTHVINDEVGWSCEVTAPAPMP